MSDLGWKRKFIKIKETRDGYNRHTRICRKCGKSFVPYNNGNVCSGCARFILYSERKAKTPL